MRSLMLVCLLACSSTTTSSKHEIPPPNKLVPATDEDARACERLAQLGCPEAMNGCLAVFTAARTDHVAVPSACLAAAVDVASVRRCGDASTLTFECRKGN